MAKISVLLSLTTWLLALLSPALAQDDVFIHTIYTVDLTTNENGGCRDREDTLDVWLNDIIQSTDVAAHAIDRYKDEAAVRSSMSMFFGITNNKAKNPVTNHEIKWVRENIEHVQNLVNFRKINGAPIYDPALNFLFCDSSFVVERATTDPALDYEGNEIRNNKNEPVAINKVELYTKELDKTPDAVPWWAGDRTQMKGYYFTATADVCTGDNLGNTATIRTLKKSKNGKAVKDKEMHSVTLCPYAFDESPQPDNYRDANNNLAQGTSIEEAVPKSATLLHEMFHQLRGGIFLDGDKEKYSLVDCIKLASEEPAKAQRNPENYVFFIAHMYHRFGEPDDPTETHSIGKNWHFKSVTRGGNKAIVATA